MRTDVESQHPASRRTQPRAVPGAHAASFKLIKRIQSTGVTIFIAKHNVQMTLDIADYAYVIEQGRVRLESEGPAIAGNPEIKTVYLGL